MIRLLTLAGIACLVGGVVLIVTGAPVVGALLLVAGMLIGAVLAVRAAAYKVRDTVRDARGFITGDVQRARLVEVSEPKGIIWPKSTVVLELEGADAKVHRIDRELPVAFPYAWGYRLGRRYNLPLLRNLDLSRTLAFELSREGKRVEVARSA